MTRLENVSDRLKASRRFLGRLVAFVIATAFCSGLSWVVAENFALLKNIENRTIDLRLVGFAPPVEHETDVVVVAITEETLAQFPYRSPVDRAFLADLLLLIESRGAKSVYLDVLLDQPTEPAKDKTLAQTLRELKIPTRVAYTSDPMVVNEAQHAYLREFVPIERMAAVNLSTDPLDGTVRWYFKGGLDSKDGRSAQVLPVPFAVAIDNGLNPTLPETNISRRVAWRQAEAGADSAFPIFPAHALKVLPPDWLKDKVVLVGAVLSITDRHRTPFAMIDEGRLGMMSGVEILAHQTAGILSNQKVMEPSLSDSALISLLAGILGGMLGLLGMNLYLTVLVAVLAGIGFWLLAIVGYGHGLPMLPLMAPTLAIYSSLFATILLVGRQERERRKFIQAAFSRYVEPAVVNRLISQPELLSLAGEKRPLSFVFTDIAGFTTLSEQIPPEQLTTILNDYLDGMCKVVHRHEGIVDKFIGDAVMAVFNAPITQKDHADRAVRCALEMDAFCQGFRVKIETEMGLALGITRIGVHSGEAIIGNFGAVNRMDFTALGDTVNAASRVEGVNKYFGTRVCVTQGIVDSVTLTGLHFRPIGDVMLKGKDKALGLYEPMDSEAWSSARVQAYMRAFSLLQAKQTEARAMFTELLETYPDDPLVGFHSERIARGELSSVIRMDEK